MLGEPQLTRGSAKILRCWTGPGEEGSGRVGRTDPRGGIGEKSRRNRRVLHGDFCKICKTCLADRGI